ncbi:MAG: hypothetical protein HXX10_04095 [Rhodoplanes sp.]|uniref:hypothetical protein n=1 Tax=Rhodoplanes sp. TaxID=1968906 RepID=UPI0017A91014|nr:hypothetical protein [Rhodoplanes sp.]NVO13196.1 hypothetical protein [Rhodoplanes sp.]
MVRAFGLGVLLVIGWVLLAGIRMEPVAVPAGPMDNRATRQGQDPWAANEPTRESVRENARQSALRGLDQAWSAMCAGEGRQRLLAGLGYYFEQRGMQERGFPMSWGEAGARHIARAWRTADDARIERLTRETYARGYFALADLDPHVRERTAALLRAERVTGHPCNASRE